MKAPLAATLWLALGSVGTVAGGPTVDLRVLTVTRGGEIPRELFVAHAGADQPVAIKPAASPDAEATPLELAAGGRIRFTAKPAPGAPVVGEATISGTPKEAVVLLLPDSNPDDEILFRCLVVNPDDHKLSTGGVILANGTSSQSRITLGGETHTVEPEDALYLAPPKEKDGYNMAPVRVELSLDGDWKPLKDSSSRFTEGLVYWNVLFTQPGANRPRLRVFKERR